MITIFIENQSSLKTIHFVDINQIPNTWSHNIRTHLKLTLHCELLSFKMHQRSYYV